MSAVVKGKRYRTDTSILLAHDALWDGEEFTVDTMSLHRTSRGAYFVVHPLPSKDERYWIEPVDLELALSWYEVLLVKEADFEDAFPCVAVEDA